MTLLVPVTFQEKIGDWFANTGTGTVKSGPIGGGGVGKYLKARSAQEESATVANGSTAVAKKRKLGSAVEFKNFSAW